jgi:hypothetical protein
MIKHGFYDLAVLAIVFSLCPASAIAGLITRPQTFMVNYARALAEEDPCFFSRFVTSIALARDSASDLLPSHSPSSLKSTHFSLFAMSHITADGSLRMHHAQLWSHHMSPPRRTADRTSVWRLRRDAIVGLLAHFRLTMDEDLPSVSRQTTVDHRNLLAAKTTNTPGHPNIIFLDPGAQAAAQFVAGILTVGAGYTCCRKCRRSLKRPLRAGAD